MKQLAELRPSTRRTYGYICDFIREKGYSPSTQEIMDGVPLSSKSVAVYHRDQLVKHRLLGYTPDRARSIEIYGSLMLTFWGEDADFIRKEFGRSPELAVIDALKQALGVMERGS